MPIRVQCGACQSVYQVKDEYGGKRFACPKCKQPMQVPLPPSQPQLFGADPLSDPLSGPLPTTPTAPLQRPHAAVPTYPTTIARPATLAAKKAKSASSAWYRRHWQWLAVVAVLVLAIIPKAGLIIAALLAFVGMLMALAGGIYPFLRVIFKAPGTVLLMILSRSARFEMMDQPDTHPYKILVRTAFDPTRGLFWRGVLLMVAFIPAAFVQSAASEFFRRRAANNVAEAPPMPGFQAPGMRPGGDGAVPGANPGDRPRPGDAPAGWAAGQPGNPPGQPGQPGFPPGAMRAPAGGGEASDRIFYVSIQYGDFSAAGNARQAIEDILKSLPNYVADSLTIDEGARQIQFQHRGQLPVPVVGRTLAQRGFQGPRIQVSTNPP